MATPTKSRSSDRRRVSSESYEVSHVARRISKGASGRGRATAAVKRAKSQLGRKTRRKTVVSRARAIARRK